MALTVRRDSALSSHRNALSSPKPSGVLSAYMVQAALGCEDSEVTIIASFPVSDGAVCLAVFLPLLHPGGWIRLSIQLIVVPGISGTPEMPMSCLNPSYKS